MSLDRNGINRYCPQCKGVSSVTKTHEGNYVCSICNKPEALSRPLFTPTKEELDKFLKEARKITMNYSFW